MMADGRLPSGIESYLRAFAARRRRLAMLRAGSRALTLGGGWALGACLIDRVAPLPWTAGMVLLVAGMAAVAVLSARPVLKHLLRRRMDWVGTARLIEQRDPRFAQRLETVASRLCEPAQQQGSRPMLERIAHELEEELRGDDPARLLPTRLVVRSCAAAAVAIVLLLALMPWGWLDLPQLLARFALPLSDVAPVTTTRLAMLEPAGADRDVPEGQPLQLVVQASQLRGDVVRLHTSADGRTWSIAMMTPLAPDRFAFTLAAMDRDLAYYASGGDAVTGRGTIRVLRRPAVSEFRVRYVYPAYTGLAPLSLNNTDGLIEAPAGTEATVTLVATEPLSGASVVLGQQRIATWAGGADNIRQATLTIPPGGDEGYRVELTSARNVSGEASGPRLRIRALPDRAPVVRLIQPASDLRLHPRDILTLHYQVMDDYGISSLAAEVQVNGVPQTLELAPPRDRRRDDGQCDVDLARLGLKIGDVLKLTLRAQDGAGQQAVSESRSILVSPRSIDLDAHQRIAELRQACQLATMLVSNLEASLRALDELRGTAVGPGTPRYIETWQRLNQHVSAASESAALVRQSLLRCIAQGSPPRLSVMLAGLIDVVQDDAAVAEEVTGSLGDRPREESARRRLATSLERARTAMRQARTLRDGEQAAAVLADRENLRTLEKAAPAADEAAADRLAQTLDRAREDIAAGVRQVGLDPASADLDGQLRSRIDAAQRLLAEHKPVDFAAAAQTWAAALGTPACAQLHLGRRLAAAAEAQAVRRDADLVEARDLQLAGWAADAVETRLASRSSASFPAGLEPRTDFAPAIAALSREHELDRLWAAGHPTPADDEQAVRSAAAEARRKMILWAGQTQLTAATAAEETLGQQQQRQRLQQMAFEAAARSARRDYDQAAQIDRQLALWLPRLRIRPGGWDEDEWRQIGRALDRARKIDQLGDEQQAMEAQTNQATAELPAQLAQRQHELAQGIGSIERQRQQEDQPTPGARQGDSREQALAAIQSAAATLALMPQQLAQAQQAAQEEGQAGLRAQAAQQSLAQLPEESRVVAIRMLGQAQKAWAEARQRTAQIVPPVAPEAAQMLSAGLWPFVPETSGAVAVIDAQLLAALRQLQQAIDAEDGAAVEKAAAQSRQAIAAVQEELRKAQAELMRRDPLVAARVFAEAAAQSLATLPANRQIAGQQQRDTSAALARAWDDSIHEAAARRLAGLPGMEPIFATRDSSGHASAEGGAPGAAAVGPTLREWGYLRPRQTGVLGGAPRDANPAPGYEDALRIYFQVLGQGQTPTQKGERP